MYIIRLCAAQPMPRRFVVFAVDTGEAGMIPVSTLKEYESRYNNLLTVHESPGGDPVLGLKIAVVLSGVMVPVTKFGCRYHPVVPMHNVKFSRLSRDREPKVEERQQKRAPKQRANKNGQVRRC